MRQPGEVLASLDRLLATPPNAVEIATWFALHLPLIREGLAALRSQAGEPVAWQYVEVETHKETLSNQPPDRVLDLHRYEYRPLYAALPSEPAPEVDTGREG